MLLKSFINTEAYKCLAAAFVICLLYCSNTPLLFNNLFWFPKPDRVVEISHSSMGTIVMTMIEEVKICVLHNDLDYQMSQHL